MNAFDVILSRRSIRSFTDKPVDEKTIEKILRAAMSAPSAANQQPWHFIVLNEREMLDRIAHVHPYAKMCLQATAGIIPCVDLTLAKHKNYWSQDLAAATQNILLAIRALGLGGVWLGVYPDEKRVSDLQQLFDLADNIIPFCVIPFGHTTVKQEEVDRFQPSRVHHNYW